ncbi:MAG: 1-acyl-sn-glycerol-3-phosphate acyltransferase [Lachnospiraceae bacterium]|nr:1-acyl-sn-glycerol-3-phosphate acyltransferase [Lachnospiraceae bacterium]
MIYEIFRWFGLITGYPFNWLYFKRKVYYENDRAKKKIKGGALIISNHFNPLDYVLNSFTFFPRKLYVVASEHAFKNAFLTFGMKFFGGIQADRVTKSMRFVIESAKELRKGHLVQIFPEGHNTDDGTIKAFYPSYIVIALRGESPIVPIITDGNYGMFKRVHMIIGEEIDLSQYMSGEKYTRDDVERLNEMVHQKVLDLRAELDLRINADKKRGDKK